MRIERRGFLLVLSSPSGAGKTTITRRLAERDPKLDMSVSVTTRPRREEEVDGRDYYFIDRRRFDEMLATETVRDDLVSVFVLPPSLAALEARLRARAQDSPAVVAARMAKSAEELSHWSEYDYVIVNRDIEDSVAQVQAIVTAERLRRKRQVGLAEFVDSLRAARPAPPSVAAS